MALDSSIPLQSVAPDPMASLSSMLDVGAKSLSLQKNRATFDADVAKSKADSSTSQSTATVNAANVQPRIQQQAAETSSAESGAFVANVNRGAAVQQATANANTATTVAENASVDLQSKKRRIAQQSLTQILTDQNLNELDAGKYDPRKAVASLAMIRDAAISAGHDPHEVNMLTSAMMSAADKPGGAIGVFKGKLLNQVGAIESINATKPDYQRVTSGDRTITSDANTTSPTYNPNSAKNVVQNPGPDTKTILPDGRSANIGAPALQPGDFGYKAPASGMPTNERDAAIGRANGDIAALRREAALPGKKNAVQMQALNGEYAQAQARLQQAQAMPAQPTGDPRYPNAIPTSLPPGQIDSIAATQKGINDHYKGLQDGASTAAQDIGVLQNIMSHAKGAATGVGAEKAALAQAIFGKLGITKAQESTVDYDLLAKNSAMLQLAGGDTNLAKTLAGAANPNSHMSEDAIRQAAHQIIGQKRMALEGLKMFTPLKALSDGGHMEAYNSMLPKFMAAADPRILQLSGMSNAEKAKMKSAMSPEEAKVFGNKIRMLDSFGIKP